MIEVLGEEQYRISTWSGGKTKELFLWPAEGSYATRDFRVRISSATVEMPESDFTYLPGVERYLMKLSGQMILTVNGTETVDMSHGRILHFSGEDKVHCEGCATDFNLMLKGAKGNMFALKPGQIQVLDREREYFLYAAEAFCLNLNDGQPVTVNQGESCYLYGEEGKLHLEGFTNAIPIVELIEKEGRKHA